MTDKTFAPAVTAALASLKTGGAFDTAKLTKLNASIKSRGRKLDLDIHCSAVAACFIAASSEATPSGCLNAEPARQLLNSMPRGSRAKTLAAWFEHHTNVRPTLDKKTGLWAVKLVGPAGEDFKDAAALQAQFPKLEAEPFWTVDEKPVDPQAFAFGAAVLKLIATAEKNLDHMTPADQAALAGLRKACAKVLPEEVA